MIWIISIQFIIWFVPVVPEDYQVESSRSVYGTEVFLLENAYQEASTYRFEDFFWTGSGDGSTETEKEYSTSTTDKTIYQTITSTIYFNRNETTTNKCSFNCNDPTTTTETITPTPTQDDDDYYDADRQFWLLTVLKSDGKDPIIIDLKNSLAKLYKTAFQRQQDIHLGIVGGRHKRQVRKDKPVKVYIHSVEKSALNGDEKIQVLYHVAVSGQPVDAITAAKDMNLVSDDEVRNELGYPFVIKAEPYLKPTLPEGLSSQNNTWVFIGSSIVALLLVLLIVAFLTLGLTKRKKQSEAIGLDNRRTIFERGGQTNLGFVKNERQSPTYINYHENHELPIDSVSTSSNNSSSLDISPLMAVRRAATPPKKPPRPKAANLTRIAPELLNSDGENSRIESPDDVNDDPGVVSPKSYLSMPSIKSFPRGTGMPEPLNKILEPVSVLHLDIPDDTPRALLTRHASVGAVTDPGVVNPLVWISQFQAASADAGLDKPNVSRMRKRFHDLLDDTFSLFGGASRRSSPTTGDEDAHRPPVEVKSRSAARPGPLRHVRQQRPKTTDLRKVAQVPGEPRGAWGSKAPSPLVRPLSADFHKLASDPAIPLIAEIKKEIERCSLPGSTSDLRK